MSTTARLRDAGRHPPAPLSVQLDGEPLTIQQWLRVLPGKRLVGQGEWQDQRVLAKLFIATGAERHWQRESAGIQALQRAGQPTPDLLASGDLPGGGYYLLTEFLAGSQSLQQCWDQLADTGLGSPAATAILEEALQAIAAMHKQGLAQTDLHLGNFLQHEQQIYVIDGDAIEVTDPGKPLRQSAVKTNLALFFAQLEPQWDKQIDSLLQSYLVINPLPELDREQLNAAIRAERQRRLDDFLSKTLRDCSQFAVTKTFQRYSVVLRSEQEALAPLLADPDSVFTGIPLLKDGGSSTVTRATIGGRDVVIKRYNIKGLGHWLKRFWRPSRAWHSWLAGWRLSFLGIATPQPLAMIERRIGLLRREAWLITEYCPGQNLLEHLGEAGDAIPVKQTADAMLRTFKQLAEARISHGDFKATNLLWYDGRVVLIDLDAMQAHGNDAKWPKAWAKDRVRFVRNWPADSKLAMWLDDRLPR
ncbi:Lipopolysaccharide kinase (Kdo/WaaP) family protein [Halopseudomonas litoralis]|uniref:Lipopolysaccharide kinase (Kdo/WaaP) family protein n=1 Tax=Halopseudomonas litoralis TaxID=797277 RepID=A0A1H1U3D9_9GAMM|nr:lipopolysaccharide kinase InaA family protein [Halopseudomonas litoralis]SDS67055.1 Lipopolysaccharide kinase (Kdo/WaaP) family protein [Halopseudomonas litoralis]